MLIEWDADVPDWPVLAAEARRAEAALAKSMRCGMSITQTEFHDALLDSGGPVPAGLSDGHGRPAGQRFDVYRNNVAVSLTEALETGFPADCQPDRRRQLSARSPASFCRQHPPDTPMMMQYGAAFPDFLDGFEPLAYGYLATWPGWNMRCAHPTTPPTPPGRCAGSAWRHCRLTRCSPPG